MATRFIASKPTGNIPPSEGSNVLGLRVLGGRGLYHFRLELQDGLSFRKTTRTENPKAASWF